MNGKILLLVSILASLVTGALLIAMPTEPTAIQIQTTSQFQNQSMIFLTEQLFHYDQAGVQKMLATTLITERQDIQSAVSVIDEAFYNQSLQCGFAVHPFNQTLEQIGEYTFPTLNANSVDIAVNKVVQFNNYAQNLTGQLDQELQSSSEQVVANSQNASQCMQELLTLNSTIAQQKTILQSEYDSQKQLVWVYIANESRQITAQYIDNITKIYPLDSNRINERLDVILAQQNPEELSLFIEKLRLLLKSLEYETVSMNFNSTNQSITIDNETSYLNGKNLEIRGFNVRLHNSTIVGVVDMNVSIKKNVTEFYFNMTRENETNSTGFEKIAETRNFTLSQPLFIIQIDQNLSDENIQNATFSINVSKESLEGDSISLNDMELFRNHDGSIELLNYSIQDNGDYYTITFSSTGLSVFAAYMVNTIAVPSNQAQSPVTTPQSSGITLGISFWTLATIVALGGMGAAYFMTRKPSKRKQAK